PGELGHRERGRAAEAASVTGDHATLITKRQPRKHEDDEEHEEDDGLTRRPQSTQRSRDRSARRASHARSCSCPSRVFVFSWFKVSASAGFAGSALIKWTRMQLDVGGADGRSR